MTTEGEDDCRGQDVLNVVFDTNAIVHGKSLQDLPLTELNETHINLLYLPQVVREMDAHKGGGSKHQPAARKFSEKLTTLLEAENYRSEPRVISGITVTEELDAESGKGPLRPGLDESHQDDHIINRCLHHIESGCRVLLVTFDTMFFVSAKAHGVPAMRLPNSWLKPPEKSESEKKLARLEAELKALQATRPNMNCTFAGQDADGDIVLEAEVWEPLTDIQLADLMEMVREIFPVEPMVAAWSVPPLSLLFSGEMKVLLEQKWHEYRDSLHPEWLDKVALFLSTLHEVLNGDVPVHFINLSISNDGSVPALNMLASFSASGPFSIKGTPEPTSPEEEEPAASTVCPPWPPKAPIISESYNSILKSFSAANTRGLHGAKAYWETQGALSAISNVSLYGPSTRWPHLSVEWRRDLHFTIASWSHHTPHDEIEIALKPDSASNCAGMLEVHIGADNMPKPAHFRARVKFVFKPGDTVARATEIIEQLSRDSRFE